MTVPLLRKFSGRAIRSYDVCQPRAFINVVSTENRVALLDRAWIEPTKSQVRRKLCRTASQLPSPFIIGSLWAA